MVLHRTLKVAVAAVVTFVSIIPIAAAEEIAQAGRIEAEIAGSCYSANVGFGSFWMTSGGFLDRIDLGNNSITRVPVQGLESHHSNTAIGEGDGTVQRIDGKNGKQLATIETDTVGRATMTVGGGFVWANNKAGVIIQIGSPHKLGPWKIQAQGPDRC